MMRSKRPDEVQVPLPSIFYLPEVEVNINHEKIKEDPVDFDLSNLNFPIIFISKKDEKADSLGSKKNKSFEEEKFSKPVQIEKKHGKLKRFDPVGPVQVTPPSKEVVISPVTEIVKVPKTNFAQSIQLTEQPHIELFLNELEKVKALPVTYKFS